MELLLADWLGTPAWFWLSFLALVIALTAFDLGVLHKEDRELGIAESLKLSAFYIGIAMLFGAWLWYARGPEPGMQYRSEEHTSELQSLMRISYAVFCLTKKKQN